MENIDTDANAMLNEELEALEKKIMLIGTADIEKFKEFMDRLKAIQSSTIGMSKKDFDNVKFSIIQNLTKLQFDFNSYMDGTETTDIGTKQVSGKSKIKSYRIGLYTSIVNDFKKIDEIDIEKLRSLKEKWNEEKQDDYLNYLPIEQSLVEEAISDAFLEYQIKYVQKRGNLPQEKFQEFTTSEEYKASIKKKLLEVATSDNVDAKTKLDIEKYLIEDNLDGSLKEEKLWKILTNKDSVLIDKTIDENIDKPGENKSLVPKNTSNLPMIVNKLKPKRLYLECTIKTKGFFGFGKEKEKKVKVKIRYGSVDLPDKYRKKIISVVIPEGIKTIGAMSFCNCINLEKVVMPTTVTEIERFAFDDCVSLTDINFPDSLRTIDECAFQNCMNLENIKFPPNIKYIGVGSFRNAGIREIDFSQGDQNFLKSELIIYHSAFKNCRNLEKVKLSDRITKLSDSLFQNCTSLKNIEFPKNLKIIGESVFENCIGLTEMMNIPDSVTEIDDYAFEGCSNLKKFKMPAYLRYMGGVVFDNNQKFDSFVLPTQLMNIDILKNLQIDEDTMFEVPENAKGHIYEKLGLSAGKKIKLSDLKCKIEGKTFQEKANTDKKRPKNKRKKSQKITDVTLQDNQDEPEI